MKVKFLFSLLCAIVLLTSCIAQQPLIKNTQSGYPEGLFRNVEIETVRSKIIEGCTSQGFMVIESSPNQIVCGTSMKGSDAVLAQMAIGNSYSTTPQRKIRFTIYKIENDIKVVAQEWIESQMAFGQINIQELKSNNQRNSVQNFLFSLGAE